MRARCQRNNTDLISRQHARLAGSFAIFLTCTDYYNFTYCILDDTSSHCLNGTPAPGPAQRKESTIRKDDDE